MKVKFINLRELYSILQQFEKYPQISPQGHYGDKVQVGRCIPTQFTSKPGFENNQS